MELSSGEDDRDYELQLEENDSDPDSALSGETCENILKHISRKLIVYILK
jgi:hypothetical protein